jgi:cystathionine gamma-synthase
VKIETLAVKAAARPDPGSGAIAPPIQLSTIYERDADGGFAHGYQYGRSGNPTRALLEERLCALEGGAGAAAFASGSAAAAAILQSLAPGDRVVAPRDMYHGVRRLMRTVLAEWGLVFTFVDMTDLAAVEAAAKGARLIWIDTPSNPLLLVTDIAAVAERARAVGAWTAVDNTFATPVMTRPLALGADLVMHSTTKYMGGHSDVTGGAVVWREGCALAERVSRVQTLAGAVLAPFDAWLVARGLQTLPLRVRAQAAGALAVAEGLLRMPSVAEVRYPGLVGHPGHEVAMRQMTGGFGGVVSFRVRGGREAAFAALGRLKLIVRATSLGGVETTAEHRRSMEGEGSEVPEDLVRVSVGLEHPDDLMGDFAQALGGS